jgi:hypothetical protein
MDERRKNIEKDTQKRKEKRIELPEMQRNSSHEMNTKIKHFQKIYATPKQDSNDALSVSLLFPFPPLTKKHSYISHSLVSYLLPLSSPSPRNLFYLPFFSFSLFV